MFGIHIVSTPVGAHSADRVLTDSSGVVIIGLRFVRSNDGRTSSAGSSTLRLGRGSSIPLAGQFRHLLALFSDHKRSATFWPE